MGVDFECDVYFVVFVYSFIEFELDFEFENQKFLFTFVATDLLAHIIIDH